MLLASRCCRAPEPKWTRATRSRIQLPLPAQKLLYDRGRVLMGVTVIADRSSAGYARIVPRKGLCGAQVDDIARLLFFAGAIVAEYGIRQEKTDRFWGIVEAMARSFIDSELNVFAGTLQSIEITARRFSGHVIVRRAEADQTTQSGPRAWGQWTIRGAERRCSSALPRATRNGDTGRRKRKHLG
jgi:hypothetical protein